MKRSYPRIILSLFVFLILFSCSDKKGFTFEGVVLNGSGKMLYLENITPTRVRMVDSVEIGKNGNFRFSRENSTQSPDFYRIRLGSRFINLAVDTTETVRIETDTLQFALNYTVEGSLNCEKIKELTRLQVQTNEAYRKLSKQYDGGTISPDDFMSRAQEAISAYKKEAQEYISTDPVSSSAYFALFQQVDGFLIFDPHNREDLKMYGAVANNWNQRYPGASRTEHLVTLYTNSLAAIRRENRPLDVKVLEAPSTELFDFSLRSFDNTEFRLSEVARGKLLLLDFTAYSLEVSPEHNRQLADVYEKFASKGFGILQVSLDADEHFWKNAASNLPWTCVIDPRSVQSDIVRKFNVQQIPCAFIFNREGEVVVRIEDFSNLQKQIEEALRN